MEKKSFKASNDHRHFPSGWRFRTSGGPRSVRARELNSLQKVTERVSKVSTTSSQQSVRRFVPCEDGTIDHRDRFWSRSEFRLESGDRRKVKEGTIPSSWLTV
ncbi:hypothetical protein EVAR_97439_1 [Eumeta japonica]|uniref:Uncharacterized protein n=1 Tax=Eumeta variegata TaxID=151549 RepID=A0A4C1WX37_EUMVA|nr:hypothetical protein EVAR_97439_1 [Eumeta japonica]